MKKNTSKQKIRRKAIVPFSIALILMMTSCGQKKAANDASSSPEAYKGSSANVISGSEKSAPDDNASPVLEASSEDLEAAFNINEAEKIVLDDVSKTVTISSSGTYYITGSSSDAMILIEADKDDTVRLILSDVELTNPDSAPLYVKQAGKVVLTLDGKSSLTNGGVFKSIDENDIDAVLYSKDDLTVNGDGSLDITSPAGHAIVCKDSMAVTGGNISLNAGDDGINTNDSFLMTGGTVNVTAGDDCIHTDGIMQIDGGTVTLKGAEGLEATLITINDGDISINAADDGINGAQKSDDYAPTVTINGGNIDITMAQGDTDAIDVNGDLVINGGNININAQFAFDYDNNAAFNGGTITVNGEKITEISNSMNIGGQGNGAGEMRKGSKDKAFAGFERPDGDTAPPDGFERPDGDTAPPDGFERPDGDTAPPDDV